MHTPKIARRTLIVNAGLGTALGAGFGTIAGAVPAHAETAKSNADRIGSEKIWSGEYWANKGDIAGRPAADRCQGSIPLG